MPEVIVEGGIRKKVACGPCIRGHRSSKCNHRDRVMIEVRKPGRPLTSSCPHTEPGCDCAYYKYTYTIPKTGDCHCSGVPIAIPNARPVAPSAAAESSARVQKARSRKLSITPSAVERGLEAERQLLHQQALLNGERTANSSDSSTTVSSATSSIDNTPRLAPTADQHAGTTRPNATTRFGFMGIGAPMGDFHVGQDPIGWDTPYPEYKVEEGTGPQRRVPRRANTLNIPWADAQSVHTMAAAPGMEGQERHRLSVHGVPTQQQHEVDQGYPPPLLQTNFMSIMGAHEQQLVPRYGMDQNPVPFTAGYSSMSNDAVAPLSLDNITSTPYPMALTPAAMPFVNGHSQGDHNCACGDGCECLGCAAHPNNTTTIEYVRYHTGFLMREDLGDASPFSPQHGLPFDFAHRERFVSDAPSATAPPMQQLGLISPTTEGLSVMGPPPTPASPTYDSAWQPSFTPTHELENFHLQSPFTDQVPAFPHTTGAAHITPVAPSHPQPQVHQQPFPQHDSSFNQVVHSTHTASASIPSQTTTAPDQKPILSPSTPVPPPTAGPTDEEPDFLSVSTLSPSDFIVAEYPMPCCGDAPGMCRCGDRCGCAGCLTHHNTAGNTNARPRAQGAVDIDGLELGLATGSCCGGGKDPLELQLATGSCCGGRTEASAADGVVTSHASSGSVAIAAPLKENAAPVSSCCLGKVG